MSDSFFRSRLDRVPVVAILRGFPADATVATATLCWDAGIELVEVPAQNARGWRALEQTAEAARARGALVGAGTVYTVADAVRARDAGAAFLVSPGLDEETVGFAKDEGLPYLPGVTTPTDIQRAIAAGLRTLKLFPAGPLGPDWVAAMLGPFPDVRLVAVGGMSAAVAPRFLAAGAIGIGVGSAMTDPAAVAELAALGRTA